MGWVTDEAPTSLELNACNQCGLCLPVCPTFRLTGRETASPRGRLMAMSAVADGTMEVDDSFADIMGSCLQCRACEVVCPSLVPFGRAMEGARAELTVQRSSASRKARHLLIGKALASRTLMKVATVGVKAAQKLRVGRVLPSALRVAFAGIRPIAPRAAKLGATYPAIGVKIGTAGLLTGCVMDVWFANVHAASIGLLQMAGYDVVVPEAQTCCGALAAHDGDVASTKRLAATNVAAFANVDVIAVDAAGCSAHMKEYGQWVGQTGSSVADRVFDVTELIATAIAAGRIPQAKPDKGEIAVQDPCHLRHVQRILDAPRAIIRAAGYTPIEIDDAGTCCGAAGIYSLLQPKLSNALGEAKAEQIRSAAVTIVASANPGCEMQLRTYLGSNYEVVHPVEILWDAVAPKN